MKFKITFLTPFLHFNIGNIVYLPSALLQYRDENLKTVTTSIFDLKRRNIVEIETINK